MSQFDERLAVLAARFAVEATDSIDFIGACLARRDWTDLSARCHSLAGRAGMFGQAQLGEAARAVEEAIDAQETASVIEPLTLALLHQLRALPQVR